MLYRYIVFVSIGALTFTGCDDSKQQVEKEKFAKLVKSAKNSDLIVKLDRNLGNAVDRVAAKPIPSFAKATLDDRRIAQRATKALMAYVEFDGSDPSVEKTLVEFIATAHSMYGSKDKLFDTAVDRLEMSLVKQKTPYAMRFPNFEAYDFVRAVFHIFTDPLFDINHEKDVTRALSCAGGQSSMCDGPSNVLVQKILNAMERIGQLIPADVVIHQSMPKFVLLPIYLFLSHNSIPIEFREWTVQLVNGFVELAANAPTDPTEANEYFESAMSMMELSEDELRMLDNISRNVKQLMSRLELSGLMGNMNDMMSGMTRSSITLKSM